MQNTKNNTQRQSFFYPGDSKYRRLVCFFWHCGCMDATRRDGCKAFQLCGNQHLNYLSGFAVSSREKRCPKQLEKPGTSPRDNTCQFLGLIFSCNKMIMADPVFWWKKSWHKLPNFKWCNRSLFGTKNMFHAALWNEHTCHCQAFDFQSLSMYPSGARHLQQRFIDRCCKNTWVLMST